MAINNEAHARRHATRHSISAPGSLLHHSPTRPGHRQTNHGMAVKKRSRSIFPADNEANTIFASNMLLVPLHQSTHCRTQIPLAGKAARQPFRCCSSLDTAIACQLHASPTSALSTLTRKSIRSSFWTTAAPARTVSTRQTNPLHNSGRQQTALLRLRIASSDVASSGTSSSCLNPTTITGRSEQGSSASQLCCNKEEVPSQRYPGCHSGQTARSAFRRR